MHAEHNQDNHRPERTGIKTTEQHCSWRDVYALMGVDSSIESSPTSTDSSRTAHDRAGKHDEPETNSGDTSSDDDRTVIA